MNTFVIQAAPSGDFIEVSVLIKGWETKLQALVNQKRQIKLDIYPEPDAISSLRGQLGRQGYKDLTLEKDRWQHFLVQDTDWHRL